LKGRARSLRPRGTNKRFCVRLLSDFIRGCMALLEEPLKKVERRGTKEGNVCYALDRISSSGIIDCFHSGGGSAFWRRKMRDWTKEGGKDGA